MGTQSVFFQTLGSVVRNVIRLTVGLVVWSVALTAMIAGFPVLALTAS